MLPNLAYWHPQIVHFVVALLVMGLAFRLVAFIPRPAVAFASPAATTLVLLGTGAAVLAVKSGTDAHGPVERIPGARDAVVEHEHLGERTRNLFLVVSALEVAAVAVGRRPARRWMLVASAAVGLVGLAALYEAAEHGGELVYRYAGGVGIRSGDSTDVRRLLVAGLYQQAMADRAAKRPDAAARWVEMLAARVPDDPAVQLLHAESLVLDRKDGKAALALLATVTPPQDNPLLRTRYGFIKADAYLAAGFPDSARLTLEALEQAFPNNPRIRQRLEQLKPAS